MVPSDTPSGDDGAGDAEPISETERSRPKAENGYRWECPYCGETRSNTMSTRGDNAFRALRTHVYLSDGDGHGDGASYPDGLSTEELGRHVKPVEDGRR